MDNKARLEVRDDVLTLHEGGYPPSKIDEALGLESGTAHDVMVAIWAKQKEENSRHGKAVRW